MYMPIHPIYYQRHTQNPLSFPSGTYIKCRVHILHGWYKMGMVITIRSLEDMEEVILFGRYLEQIEKTKHCMFS